MKRLIITSLISCAITFVYGQQYGIDLAPTTTTTTSPGLVFSWPAYSVQNFLYSGRYVNTYGFGFHDFQDGNGVGSLNAYVSSYFGIDFFTAAQRRLRVNTNGEVTIDRSLWVNNTATLSADYSDSDPNSTWNSTLSVRNNNGADNTFSRLTFVSASGGFGTISVKKTGTYTGDMYLQVRNGSGYYHTPVFIKANGRVGINTLDPDESLTVRGDIHTNEIRVDTQSNVVPDYVFSKEYKLPTLSEIEAYIQENSHLPEVPSGKEMEANGIHLKEMNLLLLKKIEELTLYQIESAKQIELLKKEVELLKKN